MVGISAASSVLSASKTVTFDKLDTNKDGTVSIDELAAATGTSSTSATTAQSTKKVEQLFKAIDKDGDGAITSTEKNAFDTQLNDRMQATGFMAQQLGGPGAPPPPSPEDMFAATDTDGSGGVSLSEFSKGSDASSISTDDAEALFKMIDADSDGSITEAETKGFFDTMMGDAQKADRGPPPPPGSKPGETPANGNDASPVTSASLLTEAAKAYGNAPGKLDLASILASITDEAA